jgi:hypothetical protein
MPFVIWVVGASAMAGGGCESSSVEMWPRKVGGTVVFEMNFA